ncbi:hypothetical protein [uncultured Azohydromonas sp.]|jgi:hypothetical protein|uniref:hypothetical protein n=1 Tax=uncultured Azohydromonas sp. TaxID=487342 RepID=UPI0026125366|nr:hypothetical protein [uncultured Azohydromonas sp.]
MQTVRAIALIEQAVQLADEQFPGDPLAEVCRLASREERQAVLCIVRSRPALFDRPPTPQNVMAALREMVRSKPAQAVLQRCPVVWAT